MAIIHKK